MSIHAVPLVLLACASVVVAQSPASTAARERQQAIQSIEFEFTVEETMEPGMAARAAQAAMDGGGKVTPPTQALRAKSENRLVISGNQIRYEDNHPRFDLRTNALSENINLAVSDGRRQKVYFGPRTGADRKNSYGLLALPARGMIAQDALQLPMMLACRGYEGELSVVVYPRDIQPTGERLRIRGRDCQVYKCKPQRMTVWVDEAAGHSPRRIRFDNRNGLELQLEIESEQDSKSGLVLPKSWTQTRYSQAGKVESTIAVKVNAVQVNRDYDAATFDLEFPPGITVDDQRNNTTHAVRPDNSLEEIDPHGNPTSSGWLARNAVWLIAVGVACVVALVAVFSWRRVLRGPRRTPPPPTTPEPGGDS